MNIPHNSYQDEFRDTRALYDQCQQYMNYHVMFTMQDGNTVDGIIQNVGTDGVHVLVGEDVMDRDDQEERYYAGGYGYGFPRRRFRRFRPQFFPLASLAALALLPYVYPPYPPYPPYPYPYY
ncbi:hypothetical protein N0O92_07755 [Alkalihalobacillus sp. MEB130]|uniref:hypothetical protein n=1 Tax=Alkalihalobacillus sp. MEB130 TaxID=2976704 RepID=UPI0028DE9B73|nr:hypothetical protein [Alkalihalobacillus sp. MEB130]MDT8860125.1 hypothetical protein [Alkalihalobacillus sp. MEB130]